MDDAEENIATGAVDLSSSRLDFYVDTLVGVRFSRPNIPQGKEIVSAYVKFIAGTASNDTTNITIIGEYGNNSRVFQNLSYNISDRRLTNQTLCWSPASWNANDTVKTPDITSIINEIITQPGWTEYSNMGIIFRTSKGQRSVYSYEGDPTKAASLYYEFRTVDPFIGINENIPGLHSGIITEVYPNPARSIVNIRMESKKDVQLDVYDHLGRLCQSTQYDKPSGLYKLNVSDLKPGVYFIQVKSGEQTQTAKLLIN